MRLCLKAAAASAAISTLALTACKTTAPSSGAEVLAGDGADADLPLPTIHWADDARVTVDIGNKSAFERKLAVIDGAKTSLRVGYFIFGFDDSASLFVKKLLEKAAQGVDVRLIIDGMTSSKNHDKFRMMIAQSRKLAANGTAKAIQVQYFRPIPDEVWADLASWGFKDRTVLESAMAGLDVSKLQGLISSNDIVKNNKDLQNLIALLVPSGDDPHKGGLVNALKAAAVDGEMPNVSFDGLTTKFFQGVTASTVTFHATAWVNMFKRFHHKMIIADDRVMMGGGRNVEDHYHVEVDYPPKVASGDKLSFMDADFETDAPNVVKDAATGFDAYWACGDDFNTCKARIRMAREAPEDGKTYDDELAEVLTRAARYEADIAAYQKDPKRILHDAQFTATGVRVGYLENRMFPLRTGKAFDKLAFNEEPSQYNAAWDALIANARPGDDVIVHNAYVLPTPSMQAAIVRAVGRGVKVTLITNSVGSSNHAAVNVAGNAMYAASLNLAEKLRAKRGDPAPLLEIQMYEGPETLHTKITVAGKTMIVGSTNADPRSKLLDTQNGVIIAPMEGGVNPIVDDYRRWLGTVMARQRDDKPVLKVRTREDANFGFPPFAEVKANPAKFSTSEKFDAYLEHLFEVALDPGTPHTTQVLVAGFLNTLLLML